MACGNTRQDSPSGQAGAAGAGGSQAAGSGGGGSAGAAGCSGTGSGQLPAPTCVPGGGASSQVATYYSLDACGNPVKHTHVCDQGCSYLGESQVNCPAPAGAPFRTCRTDAECATVRYCADTHHAKLLGQPLCNEGVCDWQSETEETCAFTCSSYSATCQGAGGSSSGAFPWAGMPAACSNGTITYYYIQSGSHHTATYQCEKSCFADATGVACDQVTGEAPFHSCEKDSDCPSKMGECSADDPSSITSFVKPVCGAGNCVWLAKTKEACPAGQTCGGSSCGG